MLTISLIALYLAVGYAFVGLFRTFLLDDDGDWGDGEFGPGSAVMLHLLWPFFVIALILIYITGVLMDLSPLVRKFYRLDKKGLRTVESRPMSGGHIMVTQTSKPSERPKPQPPMPDKTE